jgi:hypothetical protein
LSETLNTDKNTTARKKEKRVKKKGGRREGKQERTTGDHGLSVRIFFGVENKVVESRAPGAVDIYGTDIDIVLKVFLSVLQHRG